MKKILALTVIILSLTLSGCIYPLPVSDYGAKRVVCTDVMRPYYGTFRTERFCEAIDVPTYGYGNSGGYIVPNAELNVQIGGNRGGYYVPAPTYPTRPYYPRRGR